MNLKQTLAAFILVTFFIFVFIDNTLAQNMYCKIGGSYNASFNSQVIASDYNFITSDSLSGYFSNTVEKGTYSSFGKGLSFSASLGYAFRPILAFELGVSYLQSDSYLNHVYDKRTYYGGTYDSYSETDKLTAAMWSTNPSLVFSTHTGKLTPYAKVGMVIGFASKSTEFTTIQDNINGSFTYKGVRDFYSTVSYGTSSALGISYFLSNKVMIAAEVNMVNISVDFTKSEVTSLSSATGVNILPYQTTSFTKISYEKEYTQSNTNKASTNTSEPRKNLLVPTPFSSIGFGISLIFKIDTKSWFEDTDTE